MADSNPSTGSKQCTRCRETKPFSSFHKCKKNKDGHQVWCNACRKGHNREERKQYFRDFYHNNPEKYLQQMYRRRYGITLEQYEAMAAAQGGVCYLCGKSCVTGRRLAVDHDHSTGAVRKLLCVSCNKGIGDFREDQDLMRRAIAYLEAHSV